MTYDPLTNQMTRQYRFETAPDAVNGDGITQAQHDVALDEIVTDTNAMSLDLFNDVAAFNALYIGASATDPTVDANGNALVVGALYVNSAVPELRFYTGTSWVPAANSSIIIDNFVGDAVTVSFALSGLPLNEKALFIYIDGSYQNKDGFSLSGSNLIFSEAPPKSAQIEVLALSTSAIGVTSAGLVTASGGGSVQDFIDNSGDTFNTEALMITSLSLSIGNTVRTLSTASLGDGGAQGWQIMAAASYTTSATVLDLTGISGQAVSLTTKFDTVAELLADTRTDALFVADQYASAGGFNYQKALSGAIDGRFVTTAGSVKWYPQPADDGFINCESLGVTPDGLTNWEGQAIWPTLMTLAISTGVRFVPGYYAQSINFGNEYSGATFHMDPGSVFGGVFHLISSANPTKYGISTIARASNVVTVVTSTAHGYTTGDRVQIRYVYVTGSGSVDFNGDDFTITVVNTTTFTFAQIGQNESGTVIGASMTAERPLKDITVTGLLTTTDRLGAINCKDIYIERCWVKSDPANHWAGPGLSCRGAHLYAGANRMEIGELIIDDCVQPNSDAALALDGNAWNPSNIKIGRCWIKDSGVHGAYITGHGHEIGELRIDGFARDVYTGTLQDSNGAIQSGRVKAFWANRCWNSHIGVLRTSQNPAGSRGYEVYHALIDETGHVYYGEPNSGLRIDTWIANHVRRGGIRIGDTAGDGDSVRCQTSIGALEIRVDDAGITPTGYALNLNGASGDNFANIGLLRLINCGTSKGVYSEYLARGHVGKVEAVNFNAQVWDMRGQITAGEIIVDYSGGSTTDPLVHLRHPNVAGSRIGLIDIESGTITTTAFKASNGANKWSIGKIRTIGARNSTGVIVLDNQLGFQIGAFDLVGPDSTGQGIQFIGSCTDGYFGSGRIEGFALGLDKNAATFLRVTAVGLNSNGNTTGTNIPAVDNVAGVFETFGSNGVTL